MRTERFRRILEILGSIDPNRFASLAIIYSFQTALPYRPAGDGGTPQGLAGTGVCRLFSDDRKDILPAAMSVGIGFSILENTAILVQNLTVVTLGWAALRGLSASLMHGLCTMIIGAGLPYVKKQRKLFCTGIFGLFTVSATMHALFNLLIQSDYSWLGACFPMALYVLFYVVRRTGRVKLPFLSY